jgi:HEAT repeats
MALALGVLFILKLWLREPSYGGKPLSYWLTQLAPEVSKGPFSWLVVPNEGLATEKIRQAQIAIRAMGTNAVPFLLNKIRREHWSGERLYGAIWQKIPLGLRQRLSPPRQFRNYGNPHSQIVWALQTLNSDAVPALIAALRDSNSDVQITALAALGGFGTNADVAIPSLEKLAKHPNGFVRRWAIFTLGRVGPKRTNAIPTLIAALQDNEISPLPGSSARVRETAAEVLGQLGPQAQAARLELRKLLTDADAGVRREVAIALWRITGDRDVLPILIGQLKKNEDCKSIIAVLGEMGPVAKPAVPAIKDAVEPMRLQFLRFRTGPTASHSAGNWPAGADLVEVARSAPVTLHLEQGPDRAPRLVVGRLSATRVFTTVQRPCLPRQFTAKKAMVASLHCPW